MGLRPRTKLRKQRKSLRCARCGTLVRWRKRCKRCHKVTAPNKK